MATSGTLGDEHKPVRDTRHLDHMFRLTVLMDNYDLTQDTR